MPLYYFKCKTCKLPDKLLLSPEEAKGSLSCRVPGCSGKLKRTPKAPATTVTENVDNGIMVRRVQIYKDVTEVYRERSKKNFRDPDEAKKK